MATVSAPPPIVRAPPSVKAPPPAAPAAVPHRAAEPPGTVEEEVCWGDLVAFYFILLCFAAFALVNLGGVLLKLLR